MIDNKKIVKKIDFLLKKEEISSIKRSIPQIIKEIEKSLWKKEDKEYTVNELKQISEAKGLDRAKYYLRRLKKNLTEVKNGKINDLNLNRWKQYKDIITDSLWIIDKRDNSENHNASYWGNFIPQIPNQLLRRYTKEGDWVLDPFLGSGTTLLECQRLRRNGIGVEVSAKATKLAEKNIKKGEKNNSSKVKVVEGDSSKLEFEKEIKKLGVESIQFLIMHPPYWDIIKFSSSKKDLSNTQSLDEFLELFGKVVDKTYQVLDKKRYLAVVIGDKYSNGEWIPLGFYIMQEILKRNYLLKSIIVKNFQETKGKMNQKELWHYRALVGGFYIFKHEYILLFQKK